MNFPLQPSIVLCGVSLLCAWPLSLAARIPDPQPVPAERTIAPGPFKPTWESLSAQYQCPDWFRDAKLGIWAHWSAQCVPEQGDWYARNMYMQGHVQNKYHVEHYGPPSEFGFMEIDHLWKAEHWDPEKLMTLYAAAGAKYFVALANHEDNFDNYDSKYQAWNSVNVGPQKDIVGTWAKVARAHGLRFGVSNHSSHAWHWFQTAYGYDAEGPKAGVRYDAFTLKKEDGKGKWWDGLDPAELYCKPWKVIPDGFTSMKEAHAWHDANDLPWTEAAPPDDPVFANKWYYRLQDLMDKYQPDFVYLDNTELPMGQVGLDIAAHYYNSSAARNGGKQSVVLTAKGLKEGHTRAVTRDYERTVAAQISPEPFEMGTCIGQWHYKKDIDYKPVKQIVQSFVDVVSKNGTMLLSIPIRGDGTIDDRELAFLKGFTAWTKVNGEGIFASRPWKVYGEGPTPVPRGRGADGLIPYTQSDIRFTTKDGFLYVFVMGTPTDAIKITSLGNGSQYARPVKTVTLVGSEEKLNWKQNTDSLVIEKPSTFPTPDVISFKVALE